MDHPVTAPVVADGVVGRPRKQLAVSQLIFRITRFNAFIGLAYEVVVRDKKRNTPKTGTGRSTAL